MLKILIVDDNPLIRGGLGNMIEWEKLGAEPAGSAENGEEALLLCEKNQPDIVITDIRMPRKDGMELLSALQERYPDIQTIVVSAYDSFAYAKHAMTAGSINYILKPVDPVELNETISKAAKLIRSREGGTSLLLTDGLREALSGEKAAGPIYVLASAGTDEETDGFCADIFGNCVQAEEGNVRYLAGIRKKECDGLEFEKKYRRLLLRRCLGVSEPLAELSEGAVAAGMEEAVHRAYLQEFAWQGETETVKPFGQEQFFLQLDSGNSRSACAMVKDGLISCGREDVLTCEKNRDYAEQCLKMLSQYSSAGFDAAGPVMQKLLDSGKQLLYGSMDEILRDICGIIEKLCIFSAEQLHTQRHIALRMKKILEEHYQEDLSAERMAELFDYSAAYLGKLFRRESGISIGQYLIGVRMEKAAGLLLGTDMKIVDIAHQVGYADELHFQKLFKKKTGKTPGAFRKERG